MNEFFDNFKSVAYRLEVLPQYDVTNEKLSFDLYLKNKNIKDHPDKDWLNLISDKTKEGKKIKRIRIIDKKLNDYQKYELQCYKYNVLAGEEILILLRFDYEKIKSDVSNQDFWLFDNNLVVKINYDSKGKFKGIEKITNSNEVKEYVDYITAILSVDLYNYCDYMNKECR